MPELDPKIAELEARLDSLVRTQIGFQQEISTIRRELTKLRGSSSQPTAPVTNKLDRPVPEPSGSKAPPPADWPAPVYTPQNVPPPTFGMRTGSPTGDTSSASGQPFPHSSTASVGSNKGNLERFVGRSLIALIGIVILVLGVGIGAKYAIDNGWISPLMRIVFGYVIGFALIGTAAKLKAKYHTFSAVLLSGGMAIMYFVTYFAYAYYALMPQSVAFALMVIFTIFTVISAILYERQVIAHIGLIGAYAVPFLLSDNLGNYFFLFSYMAIINCGILAIGMVKNWRIIVYTAFVCTWLIYFAWYDAKYAAAEHWMLAAIFASIFFTIFYIETLVGRIATDRTGKVENTVLLLTNSFIYYGVGLMIVDSREDLRPYEGLFTGLHAILHSLVAQVVSRIRSSAVDVVQVLVILIVTFTTITVPVQLDGNNVTLVWTVEAAALFWFGRAKAVRLFEYLSYPIMMLATGSMFVDWISAFADRTSYASEFNRQPIMNGDLVTGVVFVAAFAFIYLVNKKREYASALGENLIRPLGWVLGTLAIFVLYNTFRIEIGNYFHLQFVNSLALADASPADSSLRGSLTDIGRFNALWQLNYTKAFLIGLTVINLRKVRSTIVAFATIALSGLSLLLFVSSGMYLFNELRVSYMDPPADFVPSLMNIAIRYISYVFVGGLLSSVYFTVRSKMIAEVVPERVRELCWDALCYLTLLIAASWDLINLMSQLHLPDGYKLGISIFWGVYALAMIVIGIAWSKKHLRITAMVLLAVTLVKLFLYDVADLPTIQKTILFVSLGVLLLIVSFLYNKFTAQIFKRNQAEGD